MNKKFKLFARQGKARQGKARQGKARQGKARQGKRQKYSINLIHNGIIITLIKFLSSVFYLMPSVAYFCN
ncbi:hypothetical protein EPJ70_08155 [Brachyspira aalborgi]|uniref:Uncharacterized protein n=1 Tax=Brachyspira aalborgi TaxID=29522 RepID=A0A5C8F2A2_9SPIR|nr:hypothetical protein EPJ70_08155 [Brachyspira aalborgi]